MATVVDWKIYEGGRFAFLDYVAFVERGVLHVLGYLWFVFGEVGLDDDYGVLNWEYYVIWDGIRVGDLSHLVSYFVYYRVCRITVLLILYDF